MTKPIITVVSENMIEITTPKGQKFQVICENNSDKIKVYSSTHFGSTLIVHPESSSSISLKQGSI